jgi:hypothetical protein
MRYGLCANFTWRYGILNQLASNFRNTKITLSRMKKKILLLLFTSFCSYLRAQVCTEDFLFDSQQSVDDFLINNPMCTSIDGTLTIVNSIMDTDPVLNINALQNIQSITGDILIQIEVGPVSLAGFSALTTVGGTLDIDDYSSMGNPPAILSYDGLQNLQSVSGLGIVVTSQMDLSVFDQLTNATAITMNFTGNGTITIQNVFPGITTLSTGFYYFSNDIGSAAFSGLNSLVSAGQIVFQPSFGTSQVTFDSFDAFNQLDSCDHIYFDLCYVNNLIGAFDHLRVVNQDLWFDVGTDGTNYPSFPMLEAAPSLSILMGGELIPPIALSALIEVDYLMISAIFSEINLPVLEKVGSLNMNAEDYFTPIYSVVNAPVLDSVFNDFQITGLDISDLSNFSDLDFIGGDVNIMYCPNLSNCAISAMCDKVSADAGSVYLESNATGCNAVEEIFDACSIGYVTGAVYADLNCDGEFNTGDVFFSNAIIHNENNLPVGNSYSDGTYYVGLADNTTTTIHAMNQLGFLPGSSYTLTTTTLNEVFTNYDFPLCPDVNYHDVSIICIRWQSTTRILCKQYYPCYESFRQPEDVTVTADLSLLPGASVSSTEWRGIRFNNYLGSKWIIIQSNCAM